MNSILDEKKIDDKFLANLIDNKDEKAILDLFKNYHPADIHEVIEDLSLDDKALILNLLDNEVSAEVIVELSDSDREKILELLSSKEIAQSIITEIDSNDAVDIISELPKDKKEEVISHIDDISQANDIIELLRYDEDSAGGIMAKEFIAVNISWSAKTCIDEIRRQAEQVNKVHTVYVVDDDSRLKGTLSIRKLLITSTETLISSIYKKNIHWLKVDDSFEEVYNTMQKYDLFTVPVVDDIGRLVGRIVIDDVVDIAREESDKDYQLASGISKNTDSKDSLIDITKARLPWLVLGLFGGLASANIMGLFDGALTQYPELFFFTPLIAAMGGNVGVQSSALIVQGLANDSIDENYYSLLLKEIGHSLISGTVLSVIILSFEYFVNNNLNLGIIIAISLITVIIISSLIGTFIPILLNKKNIDPALATGPFITTSNDIIGILVYFSIAKIMLGF